MEFMEEQVRAVSTVGCLPTSCAHHPFLIPGGTPVCSSSRLSPGSHPVLPWRWILALDVHPDFNGPEVMAPSPS